MQSCSPAQAMATPASQPSQDSPQRRMHSPAIPFLDVSSDCPLYGHSCMTAVSSLHGCLECHAASSSTMWHAHSGLQSCMLQSTASRMLDSVRQLEVRLQLALAPDEEVLGVSMSASCQACMPLKHGQHAHCPLGYFATQVTPVSTETRPTALSPSRLVSPLSVSAAAGKWEGKT